MQINGPAQIHGAQPINAPHRTATSQASSPGDSPTTVDQLDISREADLASRLRDVPDIRADKVAEIRAQIDSGVYETDDKLDTAVSRLLDEIG
ncbi:MAG: flagellar biosynthesis anti-sigma factor FlgM [Pirellulaceae bacterium]